MTVVNTVRANRFVAAALKCNPLVVNVPVLGGQSCDTTVPIFSRARPKTKKLPKKKIEKLTTKVKESGITVKKIINFRFANSECKNFFYDDDLLFITDAKIAEL